MCVIIYKPCDTKINRKDLRRAFEKNPDGSGFMYQHKDNVIIQKGFMTFKALWRAIQKYQDKDIVIHCRIGTSGINNQQQCHPFPISKVLKDYTRLRVKTRYAIAHNGIIEGFGDKKISDTIDYTHRVLSNCKYKQILRLLETDSYNWNKYIVMTGKTIEMIGDFIDYKGMFVSNDYFIPKESKDSCLKESSVVYGECSLCKSYGMLDEWCICSKCNKDFIQDYKYTDDDKSIKW